MSVVPRTCLKHALCFGENTLRQRVQSVQEDFPFCLDDVKMKTKSVLLCRLQKDCHNFLKVDTARKPNTAHNKLVHYILSFSF